MNFKKRKYNFFLIFLSVLMIFTLVGCVVVNISFGHNDQDSSGGNSSVSTTDFSKLTYCAYGDSITQGGYPQSVKNCLNLLYAHNKGIGGTKLCESSDNITDRVLDNTRSYNIISLMGGTNDFGSGYPLGTINDTSNLTIYGALNVIAAHLTTGYPDSFVFFMSPLKRTNWDTANSAGYTLDKVAIAVKEVAQKYDIAFLDLFNLSTFDYNNIEHTEDGLHPTADFRDNYLAPQIADFIKTNYK